MLFPGKTQFAEEGDKVDKIPAERIIDTINPFSYFSAANKINKFDPDLYLVKYWMPFFAPSLGFVAGSLGKKGCKRIAILDNVIPHEPRPGDAALNRYFLKRFDGFVAMSGKVERDLTSLKPNAKCIRIEHPLYDNFGGNIDKTEAREKLGLPADKKIALFFGFIRGYKGLDILLESLADLPEDYAAIIAGEPYGDFGKYEKIIADKDLESRVYKFVRYVPDEETKLFFSAADVCALPYKSATQSGIVGISFNFDLPVVATDTGGLRETIEAFGGGIFAERPDKECFAAALKKYFDRDMQNKLSENIVNSKKSVTWRAMAEKILQFYEKL